MLRARSWRQPCVCIDLIVNQNMEILRHKGYTSKGSSEVIGRRGFQGNFGHGLELKVWAGHEERMRKLRKHNIRFTPSRVQPALLPILGMFFTISSHFHLTSWQGQVRAGWQMTLLRVYSAVSSQLADPQNLILRVSEAVFKVNSLVKFNLHLEKHRKPMYTAQKFLTK